MLGGEYGTTLSLNYSRANAIDQQRINDTTPVGTENTLGYKSNFFKVGKELYFEDFNIELTKKLSSKVKMTLSYIKLTYNKDVIEAHPGADMLVFSDIAVGEIKYSINSKNTLRLELQHLSTQNEAINNVSRKKDHGNWAMFLAEYTIAPHWFIAALDAHNYVEPGFSSYKKNELAGIPKGDLIKYQSQIHYYTFTAGYLKGTTRIALGYGRQRAGLFCVGGVCRQVPASNGLTLSVTSSF